MAGISNKTIVKIFAEKINDDIKKKFVGVFSSNYIVRFISFHNMMTESGVHYPFIIINTDQNDKKSSHWWSFLDLHPKKENYLFDSFGFEGFKEFILKDNQKVLNKILYVIETTIDLLHLMNKYEKEHKLRDEVTVRLVDDQLQMIERDTCGMYQIYFYVNLFNPLKISSIISKKNSQ